MRIADDELMAYLDGELAPERAAWLSRQIAASPELQMREAEMRELLGTCTAAFALLRADDPALPRVVDLRPEGASHARLATSPVRPLTDGNDSQATQGHVVDLAMARERQEARHRTSAGRTGWLRAAALVFAVGGAGALALRSLSERVNGDVLAEGDPTLRAAIEDRGTSPRAPGADTRPGTGRTQVASGGTAGDAPTPGIAAADYVVEVSSSAVRVVASTDQGGSAPAGHRVLMTGDGTHLELDYGQAALQGGGLAVAVRPGEPAPIAGGPGRMPAPPGARALGGASGQAIGPTGEVVCPSAIRWRDPATGVELRLNGAMSCERLQALAAQLRVALVPR